MSSEVTPTANTLRAQVLERLAAEPPRDKGRGFVIVGALMFAFGLLWMAL